MTQELSIPEPTDEQHFRPSGLDDFDDFFLSMMEGPEPSPRKVTIYGGPGIGKTTFGSMAPSPAIIQTEDGSKDIKVPGVKRFPVRKRFGDVWEDATKLAHGRHPFKTAVLDSADWLEELIKSQVAFDAGKDTIGDIAYGRGWDRAELMLRKLLALFDVMHDRGMHVLLIAHAEVVKHTDPAVDSYDKWVLRVDKRLRDVFVEWSTEVLFATRKVYTTKEDAGFGKKNVKAVGGDERILLTTEQAGYVAKNRLDLPAEMPLDWREFAKYLPAF